MNRAEVFVRGAVSNRCENCWSVSIGAIPVRRPAAPSKYSGN